MNGCGPITSHPDIRFKNQEGAAADQLETKGSRQTPDLKVRKE
jgi:hypothetical protein